MLRAKAPTQTARKSNLSLLVSGFAGGVIVPDYNQSSFRAEFLFLSLSPVCVMSVYQSDKDQSLGL